MKAAIQHLIWMLPLSLASRSSSFKKNSRHRLAEELTLTASSPFRMILSETGNELEDHLLTRVEDTLVEFIMEQATDMQVTEKLLKSIEIVFQSAAFQVDRMATRINFFALATLNTDFDNATINATSSQTEQREYLDGIILRAFPHGLGSGDFLDLLLDRRSGDAPSNFNADAFRFLDTVLVALVLSGGKPESTKNSHGRDDAPLSILDMVLVAVSALILLGIVYMIALHVHDRGIFENWRRQALNTPTFAFPPERCDERLNIDEDSAAVTSQISNPMTTNCIGAYDSRRILCLPEKSPDMENSPATPNTAENSNCPDALTSDNVAVPSQVAADSGSPEMTMVPTWDGASTIASSVNEQQCQSDFSVSSQLESFLNNCFNNSRVSTESPNSSQVGIVEDFESTDDDLSQESKTNKSVDDVFNVDPTKQDTRSSSLPINISEWTDSLHVIVGDDFVERNAQSDSKGSPSVPPAKLDVSSLGKLFYEETMVDSMPSRSRSFSSP